MKAAIVTLLIGDSYQAMWKAHCAANWAAYARTHNFDLITIDAPIDSRRDARTLNWQKLLIGRHPKAQGYDYLIWIDGDIVINTSIAPSILEKLPPRKVGAVHYHALLRQPLFLQAHRAICAGQSPEEFNRSLFRAHGIDFDTNYMLNTGVLAVPRDVFADLEQIYDRYPNVPHKQQQEQVFVSYELFRRNLTHFLDDKFNAVWYEYKYGIYFGDGNEQFNRFAIQKVLSQVYFLHFAGNQKDMRLLTSNTTTV